jgi:hypothetical protein
MEGRGLMERVVQKLVALGVPGLVLLVAMGTTGLYGGAAIVAALAMLGGPFGILGGIGVLGIVALLSDAIAQYGIQAIFKEVLKGLLASGYSEQEIRQAIASYPITSGLRSELNKCLDNSCSPESQEFGSRPISIPPAPAHSNASLNYSFSPLEQKIIDLIAEAVPDLKTEYLRLDRRISVDSWGDYWDNYDIVALLEDEFNLTDDESNRLFAQLAGGCTVGDVVDLIRHSESNKDDQRETNTLRCLVPFRWGGTWVFDDPAVGLDKEPFVVGIPELIDILLTRKGMKNVDRFRLTFSASEIPGYDEKINMRFGPIDDGTGYETQSFGMTGFMFSRALDLYFYESPEQIYVKLDPYSDQ